MADRPITFSAPMVRALLAGRKTQTRRILKPQPDPRTTECSVSAITRPCQWMGIGPSGHGGTSQWDPWRPLRASPGDRIYVREHWKTMALHDKVSPSDLGEKYRKGIRSRAEACPVQFLADGDRAGDWAYPHEEEVSDGWKPGRHRQAMHMPRWASRLTLIVTDVKIERLQSISDDNAWAEGVCAAAESEDIANGKPAWGDIPNHYRRLIVDQTYGGPARAFNWLWDTLHGRESWEGNPFVVAISFRVVRGNIETISQKEAA